MDEYERLAQRQLEPALGPMTAVDVAGGRPGQHDFEVMLLDGGVGAIEVTSVVDAERRNLSASIARRLSGLRVGSSRLLWIVGLLPSARVRALSPGVLERLIADLDAEGRTSASNIGHGEDPWASRLGSLGIESIHGVPAREGSDGLVFVRAGTYGGVGWGQEAIDAWLTSFLSGSQAANKVEKLGRAANAREKHLVVVLDSFSEAGMGVGLALTARQDPGAADFGLPTVTPPAPITHLWLISDVVEWDGLLWTKGVGWAVLSPVPFVETAEVRSGDVCEDSAMGEVAHWDGGVGRPDPDEPREDAAQRQNGES
ncbi:hypothetical protein AB0F43_11020 [Kribbella sp. NPDC023972]|uniref:hypothetical protein n=1 Tax=Kribbella sp. NPDC023972 TaxID=3154795 RepID=UPI0033C22BD2